MPDSNATLTDLIDHSFEVLRVLQTADGNGFLTEIEGKTVQAMLDAGLREYGEWFMEGQDFPK